jgi:SNF2 family DNA or RNA helicase
MAKPSATKNVLLLQPDYLMNGELLSILTIQKTNNLPDYLYYELEIGMVRKLFPLLPLQAKDALLELGTEKLTQLDNAIERRYKEVRSGKSHASFFVTARLREIYNRFAALKPFFPLFNFYHRTVIKAGRQATAPCSFSNFTPRLSFAVYKSQAGQLMLETNISINDSPFPLNQFNRNGFLLEHKNEYFLLSFQDAQTLAWLQENDRGQHGHNATAFAEHVLSELEKNYKVNRNGHFEEHTIATLPQNRVLFSEISGSFLVLTPQWVYDGFVADGNYETEMKVIKDGQEYIIKRHREQETNFSNQLQALHPNFTKQLNNYYYLNFAEAQKKMWFVKTYHHLLDNNVEITGMDLLKHFRYSALRPATEASIVKTENDTLYLHATVKFGDETIALSGLQKMLLNGQKAILLQDGSLGLLPDDWLEQYAILIKHAKIKKEQLELPRWLALTEEDNDINKTLLKPTIDELWWAKWKQWQTATKPIFPVPKTVKATLRPYQQKGYEWLMLLHNAGASACLADDMGLGKTLQTICFLAARLNEDKAARCLIICPTSLVYNWTQELSKFLPQAKTAIYHGPQRSSETLGGTDAQIIVTTYGTVRSDVEKLKDCYFSIAVLDESHNIKNPSALITKAVNQLYSGMRIALSGTPVMNNTFDLFAQMHFLMPGLFGSSEFFKKEYADPIDRQKDEAKVAALRKITHPFVLRRTKEQVATDLPEKIESVLWCEMGQAQAAAYEAIRSLVSNSLFLEIKQNGVQKGKLQVLAAMQKLRQACNSCAQFEEPEWRTPEAVKLEVLEQELENIGNGHKVLVFSQFKTMLSQIEPVLQRNNIGYLRMDGDTPMKDRQQLVNRFQSADDSATVFLISLKTGNAGLNLTAADYVFIVDPWWNTAIEQQAIDRTHRIGQKKSVFAYRMICRNTIEEKILTLQKRKKKLATDLVGEDDGFVKTLNEEDIQFLFS